MSENTIDTILQEGEGLSIEFKERPSKELSKELVAFANARGGSLYLGVNDYGEPVGIDITNKLKSDIQNIARNCEPSIEIKIISHKKFNILEIHVPEGQYKPYHCKEGFFLRNGPCSDKLKRDEIIGLIQSNNHIQFDNAINSKFKFPQDFSKEKLDNYLHLCGINSRLSTEDILISLNVAELNDGHFQLNNAGVLFFAKDPQKFFPEAFITCVQYKSHDRFSIIDKKDMQGSPIEQIEGALTFLKNHMPVEISITSGAATREEIYDYPLIALREAIVNAVTHRNYLYDFSHVYINLYPNEMDIENPGGLHHSITLEMLGKRSIRRNSLIADLLHRAKYIERVGSGIDRIRQSLVDNNNPELEVASNNFFSIRFYPRIKNEVELALSRRQMDVLNIIKEKGRATKREIADLIHTSDDTAIRELNFLLEKKLIKKEGRGKSTSYAITSK